MKQIPLTPYQPMAIQPQVFYVIERNEFFQLFKEWLSPEQKELPSPLEIPANPNCSLPQFTMPYPVSSCPPQDLRSTYQPPMVMPEGYYSRDETARILQVDKSTLWRWNKDGILKCIKLGPRKVGYSKDVVKGFIDKRNQDGM